MSKKAIHWSGVFPAVSTQFRSDYSLDFRCHSRGDEKPGERWRFRAGGMRQRG